ncbi:hypothetical protein LZC95_20490 [Pendulispora brunnea]|uniref:Uncharacterized protein n=1 Tax=Pendulispora brunnea TaxID=2905690 RepID=A0ABZ2KQA2_9BACT
MMSALMPDHVVENLLRKLAELLIPHIRSAGATVVYSTSKRGPHCPGKSRSWMLRHIKTIPGARQIGRDWVIDAADFDQWARANDARRFRKAAPVAGDAQSLATQFLRAAGFRPTKGPDR